MIAKKSQGWRSKLEFIRIYSSTYHNPIDPRLGKCFSCVNDTNAIKNILAGCKIVVATLCGVARMHHLTGWNKFSYIFIDEAAASMEPEALMAIVGVKQQDCHVILSGDHKQLGPVIKSQRAASLGLGQSLMERLLLNKLYNVNNDGNYDTRLQSRLRRNYRSHPAIVGIYNKLYYDNQLIPLAPLQKVGQAAKWSILPNGEFPILFNSTYGKTERARNSTSSFNELEAERVCWFVKFLLKNGLGDGIQVQQDEIGVVTPYLAQAKLLKRMLNLKDVEVGSVERYQGREKPVIIVSLVSSFMHPHFLSNPKRVNVFLSRAKFLMILIGNPTTLSENDDFKYIIDQCKQHGNCLSDDFTHEHISAKEPNQKQNDAEISSSSSTLHMDNLVMRLEHLGIYKKKCN